MVGLSAFQDLLGFWNPPGDNSDSSRRNINKSNQTNLAIEESVYGIKEFKRKHTGEGGYR